MNQKQIARMAYQCATMRLLPLGRLKRRFMGMLDRFVRRPRPWVQSQLVSRDGQMIYTVRDREGDERQVLHNQHGWEPVSVARFSTLPCFEDYHRDKFYAATRYAPNARPNGLAEGE